MKNWQEERNYKRIKQPDGTVKNMIFVDGQAVEVSDEVFAAYSQMDRQERYQEEIREEILHVSWEKLADACVPIEEYMPEHAPSPEDICIAREDAMEQAKLLRRLPDAMKQLTESERELIQALFLDGIPAREYARRTGVYHRAVIYRRDKILKKLEEIFKKMM